MKTLRNSFIAMCALFVAASCTLDDVENRPAVAGTDAPVLTSPEEGNVYTLSLENADLQAERFTWTAANFGEGIIPSYDVEIDYAGQEFDTPAVVASTNGTTQISVSTSVLNAAMETLGAEPEEPGTFQVRIKAYVADMVLYSNPVEISVTPYQGVIPIQQLYILGTATEFGYDNNANNTPLFRDPANQFLFNYRGYFSAGELKLISVKGQWQPQYGSAGDGILGMNDGTTSDPAAIMVPAAGYYDFTVNLDEMTYSLVPFDASAAPTYSIGILGDATPTLWDSDTNLTNTPGNTHIWHLDSIVLVANGAKFRADDAWTNSWGAATFPSGKGNNASDPNIVVTPETAGTYSVWFNDLDGRYLFIPAN